MRLRSTLGCVALGLYSSQTVQALQVDITSTPSITSAASKIAFNMMKYYTGNNTGDTPGNLPPPYYWWECGAMFGTLIDYWYYTNDTTYNAVVTQGMLHQAGPNADFQPVNQTKALGNDDQGFWGMAAMSAAEARFPDPPKTSPQWVALAQAVFNTQAERWDMTTCGGGLRWQIFQFNNGFDYKNSIANGCFFNIATRLAAYTGNATYAVWAIKTWDWMRSVDLIDNNYNVFDGSDDKGNCTEHDTKQWSYNAGIFLLGAAVMYDYTNKSALWEERVRGLLNVTVNTFFLNGVMWEQACENTAGQVNFCNTDQLSFKAHLSRWLASTMRLAPFTAATISPLLKSSAAAAALQCSGGNDGTQCGHRWTMGSTWDGTTGVGQQMDALEVISGLLIQAAPVLVSNSTGGTSVPNAAAGGNPYDPATATTYTVTTAGKAGAGIFTTLVLACVVAGTYFTCRGD